MAEEEADKKTKAEADAKAEADKAAKGAGAGAGAGATEHWRVRRVLRFTQPVQGPWLLQGPPKPLSSYPQGSKLLEWVIYRLSRQQYTYAQP